MRLHPRIGLLLIVMALATLGPAATPAEGPEGWKLVWSDEFDGTAIDQAKWGFDLGNGFRGDNGQYIPGWGNDELEYYTRRPENAYVEDGSLHIRARKEPYQGFGYTSARLTTRRDDKTPLFAPTYGRFEFRAKLPKGRGLWPAIWLLPAKDEYGGWAASGEIDVMEARGQEPGKVLGTLHYGAPWPGNKHTGSD
jgi:beta-glucanase (GH16 family)